MLESTSEEIALDLEAVMGEGRVVQTTTWSSALTAAVHSTALAEGGGCS